METVKRRDPAAWVLVRSKHNRIIQAFNWCLQVDAWLSRVWGCTACASRCVVSSHLLSSVNSPRSCFYAYRERWTRRPVFVRESIAGVAEKSFGSWILVWGLKLRSSPIWWCWNLMYVIEADCSFEDAFTYRNSLNIPWRDHFMIDPWIQLSVLFSILQAYLYPRYRRASLLTHRHYRSYPSTNIA